MLNRKEIEEVVKFCFHQEYGGKRPSSEEDFKYHLYDRYSQLLKGSREHVDWKVKFYTDEFIRVNSNGTTD